MLHRYHQGPIEHRAASEDTPSTLTGRGVVYNQWTELYPGYFERIAPAALERTLAREGADVVSLFNHDRNMILGRTLAGTLALEDSDESLRYTVPLDVENRAIMDAVARPLARGEIVGSSFTFEVAAGGAVETAEEEDVAREDGSTVVEMVYRRTVTDAELWEVGPVTFAAYEGTDADLRSILALGNESPELLVRQLETGAHLTRPEIRSKLESVLAAIDRVPGPSADGDPAEILEVLAARQRLLEQHG